MASERILITGANGLLGQELVQKFGERDSYKLLATGRETAPRTRDTPPHDYEKLDVCKADDIQRIFADFSPEYVINCAAMTAVDACETNRDECWRVNAEAVEQLAKACHSRGTHLIQLSTDFVFDGKNGPYRENDRPEPLNFYGKAKLAGENAARTAGVGKWTVVRTNVVYGAVAGLPRMDFVEWVCNNLQKKKRIGAYTDQWRTPSYTHDLALGILRIVHFQKNGVYNLSGRELMNMYDFALSIAQAFDLDPKFIKPVLQNSDNQPARRPKHTGLITLKAETELDYRPLSLKAALAHLRLRKKSARTGHPPVDAWC